MKKLKIEGSKKNKADSEISLEVKERQTEPLSEKEKGSTAPDKPTGEI